MTIPYNPLLKPPLGTPINKAVAKELNLIGYWLFNEKGKKLSIALDSSGNANHGTLAADTTYVDGKYGSALDFPGTDDYIEFPIINPVHISVIMSINFDNDPSSNEHRILGENSADMPVLFWWDNGNDQWALRLRTSSGESSQFWGSAPAQDEVVVPAFTYNGVTRSHYVNGVLISTSGVNTGNLVPDLGLPMRLGGEINFTPDLNGQVDWMIIARGALTADKVARLSREPFYPFKDPNEDAILGGFVAVAGANEGAAMYHHLQMLGAIA